MVPLGRVGLVVWCLGLVLTSRGTAFVLSGHDWSYQSNPMGEDWLVCSATMPGGPGGGGQRTKDGAVGWNDSNFTFTFGADACASSGVYPLPNNVNQVDFGGGLGLGVLAETTSWFFTNNPADTIECDMRFSNLVPWYAGTGIPPATQFDWWSVAIHEMGHCLGLGHETRVTNPIPVMFPSFAAGEVRRTLTFDDSAGRNALYGAPSGWALVPGGGLTPSAPAATVLNGNLGLFVRGTDSRLYVNWLLTTDQWSGWLLVPGGGLTPSAPAVTVLNGNLGLFVQGTDNRLYVNWLLTSDQWTGWALVPGGGLTPSAPTATVLDSDLGLFVRGIDDHLYVNWLLTSDQWTGWSLVPGGGASPSTPAATVLDGALGLFVRGTDSRVHVNWLLSSDQ